MSPGTLQEILGNSRSDDRDDPATLVFPQDDRASTGFLAGSDEDRILAHETCQTCASQIVPVTIPRCRRFAYQPCAGLTIPCIAWERRETGA